MASKANLTSVLESNRAAILAGWLKYLDHASGSANGHLSAEDLRKQATDFLTLLASTARHNEVADLGGEGWQPVRAYLEDLSRQRVLAGFSSDETATFIF